jgi:hypothetical protein
VLGVEVIDQQADQRMPALLRHREQPRLFLEHVVLERAGHLGEVIGHAGATSRACAISGGRSRR